MERDLPLVKTKTAEISSGSISTKCLVAPGSRGPSHQQPNLMLVLGQPSPLAPAGELSVCPYGGRHAHGACCVFAFIRVRCRCLQSHCAASETSSGKDRAFLPFPAPFCATTSRCFCCSCGRQSMIRWFRALGSDHSHILLVWCCVLSGQ